MRFFDFKKVFLLFPAFNVYAPSTPIGTYCLRSVRDSAKKAKIFHVIFERWVRHIGGIFTPKNGFEKMHGFRIYIPKYSDNSERINS